MISSAELLPTAHSSQIPHANSQRITLSPHMHNLARPDAISLMRTTATTTGMLFTLYMLYLLAVGGFLDFYTGVQQSGSGGSGGSLVSGLTVVEESGRGLVRMPTSDSAGASRNVAVSVIIVVAFLVVLALLTVSMFSWRLGRRWWMQAGSYSAESHQQFVEYITLLLHHFRSRPSLAAAGPGMMMHKSGPLAGSDSTLASTSTAVFTTPTPTANVDTETVVADDDDLVPLRISQMIKRLNRESQQDENPGISVLALPASRGRRGGSAVFVAHEI